LLKRVGCGLNQTQKHFDSLVAYEEIKLALGLLCLLYYFLSYSETPLFFTVPLKLQKSYSLPFKDSKYCHWFLPQKSVKAGLVFQWQQWDGIQKSIAVLLDARRPDLGNPKYRANTYCSSGGDSGFSLGWLPLSLTLECKKILAKWAFLMRVCMDSLQCRRGLQGSIIYQGCRICIVAFADS
jgi:hypothetical protein